ncbi:acyl carrier protein [Streptomyces niveus]
MGLRLTATLIFDHPTPTALARHLRDRLLPKDTAAGPDLVTPSDAVGGLIDEIDEMELERLVQLALEGDDL